MSEKVNVNGSMMDLDYFNENLKEAKSYHWEQSKVKAEEDHRHCIVCLKAISKGQDCFKSANSCLCDYCYQTYIAG